MFDNKFTKKDPVVEEINKIISEEPKQIDEISKDLASRYLSKTNPEHSSPKEVQKRSSGRSLALMKKWGDKKHGLPEPKVKATEGTEHSFASYLIDNYKNSQFDLDQIDEKEMSPAQQKKKEEIVLSMKDKTKEFKAKYGKRWKDVMYATATKMAMKEETLDEKWDDEDDDVARADRELARMKAKPIKPHEKTDPDKEISKLAKKTPKEVDEEVDLDDIYENYECGDLGQIDEISKKTAANYMMKVADTKDSELSKKRQKGFNTALSKFKPKMFGAPKVKATEEVELQENYADMPHAAKELVLHADNDHHLHHSSHTPIMNNLKKKMKKGTYHPEKAKKLWAYHADRAAQSYAKHHGDGTPWHKMFSTSDRKHAAAHWEDMHRHELHEAKDPSMDAGCGSEQPFVTNESPLMKKIKDVAAKAHSRIKNEMLGKAGATSEHVDPNVKTTDMLRGRVKGGKKDDVGPGADGKSTKIRLMDGEPPKE